MEGLRKEDLFDFKKPLVPPENPIGDGDESVYFHPVSDCSIYRVPKSIREGYDKAFSPRLVSLGPFHHHIKDLQALGHKESYFDDFMRESKLSTQHLFEFVKGREEAVRKCYAETIELKSNDLVRCILVDAVFIIEILLKNRDRRLVGENDRIFKKPWLIHDIKFDMLKMENQIPFTILEDLLALHQSTRESGDERLSLEIADDFAKVSFMKSRHFVDALRNHNLPSMMQSRPKKKFKSLATPSVTELSQAGVKFHVGSGKSLFDIRFSNGTLEIPKLIIYFGADVLFRNLIGFEKCNFYENYINDYIIFIGLLVHSQEDVEMLVEEGIIRISTWDSKEVFGLIKSLVKGARFVQDDFYFSGLCAELNEYYRIPWHRWKAMLKRDYFNSPWSVISVIAAVVLLLLTLVQTVFSVISK
ncbi:hypothetical protein BT93_L3531 [Corymbia citriodora subsp. variegata]|uniref:Uncharacterized protein n=1 Tax=Corymbia citriodora subsp. variegata TaxID=360336 RepID=A0A8T0CJI8_CORYI|nr:hypothetical protein BT93_L3531 [Corymbia citriodora subsp. variegata]